MHYCWYIIPLYLGPTAVCCVPQTILLYRHWCCRLVEKREREREVHTLLQRTGHRMTVPAMLYQVQQTDHVRTYSSTRTTRNNFAETLSRKAVQQCSEAVLIVAAHAIAALTATFNYTAVRGVLSQGIRSYECWLQRPLFLLPAGRCCCGALSYRTRLLQEHPPISPSGAALETTALLI